MADNRTLPNKEAALFRTLVKQYEVRSWGCRVAWLGAAGACMSFIACGVMARGGAGAACGALQ